MKSPLAAAVLALAACHPSPPARAPAAGPAAFGSLEFPVTGSPRCNALFARGMLQLHSFLYGEAHATFAEARATAAPCTMAAWGDAMTYDHAIWQEQDGEAARAALASIAPAELAAVTPKEQAYIAAARTLFAGGDKIATAREHWLAAAAKMHADYPDDDEVALQHALALIAVDGYNPEHVREQMEAGAIALGVLARRPEHPGAAHYAIHAFDSRDHAILALPAARLYAKIAPAAGHAQHMPSHTFAHLGMWQDVIPSNERAIAAKPADWHSYSWLVAALVETGQFDRAKQTIADARARLVANRADSSGWRYDFANMIAIYVTTTQRWDELEPLIAPIFAPAYKEGEDKDEHGDPMVACGMHAPGGKAPMRMPTALFARMMALRTRAEAALAKGDRAGAEQAIADIEAVRGTLGPWRDVMDRFEVAEWTAVLDDLRVRATGDAAAIEKRLAAAIEREDAAQNVGPGWYPTPREVLAAHLLATKPGDALALYRADLADRPNRWVAMRGVERAAAAVARK